MSGNSSVSLSIEVIDRSSNAIVATHSATTASNCIIAVPSVSPWSPSSPSLYDIVIKAGDDEVQSYTGFRTIGRGMVNGVERILLNGEAIFPFGTLDQGFW